VTIVQDALASGEELTGNERGIWNTRILVGALTSGSNVVPLINSRETRYTKYVFLTSNWGGTDM